MKRSEKEKDAALEYTKERNAMGVGEVTPGADFNEIYYAFLAGIDWYKSQVNEKPDKEYYGF